MLIRGQMGVIRANCFIFLVILLCALVVSSSGYKERREEAFLRQLVDLTTGAVDEDMAEPLWIHCGQDFIRLKEAVEYMNLCFPEETPRTTNDIDKKSQSMEKENIEKVISALHPQLKQTLLDCVRKNNLLSFVPGEEGGSNVWYTMYLELLFSWSGAPRRKLAAQGPQSSSETPTPTPAPAPAPTVRSSIFSPAPSPGPGRGQQSHRPAASPRHSFFPPVFKDSKSRPPSASENSSGSPDSGSNIQANEGNNHRKSIIIAVAVTASVTFVVSALFFLCCIRWKGYGVRQNDERPLLSLSLSDYSIGSSPTLGGSIKEEKLGHQSFSNNSNLNKKTSSFDGNFYIESDVLRNSLDGRQSLEAVGSAAKNSTESFDASNINVQIAPPLKPPPGRLSTSLPGRPPLNPPPGWAQPLPPEPAASLKPPPSRAGLPPPPPPVPTSSRKTSSGSAGPPPPPAPLGPRPPPPPKSGLAPPRPPPLMAPGSKAPRPPVGPKHLSSEGAGSESDADAPKAKLKPFFWDKVLANPDHSMVWHQIKSGSFQFNEEMIETLFGYASADKNRNVRKESSSQDPLQFIQILDPKKAQNLSILLRALNVTTEEVCDALHEGNELPAELLQTLLKMAPTADEELKLRLFNGELSQLGPAERFLKALVGIPFAFKRLEALLFMCTLQEEVALTKESFETLEVACKELRNSRLFLKLLEAVLKTGNRMNDGTFRGGAQAFKLDTLLKLSDVKGTDGKITLLHFVVQEIIRSEGVRAGRAARESRSFSSVKTDDLMLEETSDDTEDHYRSLGLQVVSRLSTELENVKKSAIIDADSLTGTVAKLGHALQKTRDFLNSDMKSLEEDSEFHQTLKSFVQNAEVDVMGLLEEEKRIMALVKSTGDYFHGKAGNDEGVRLFVIVRDFLIMLDKVCKEVRDASKKPARTQKKEVPASSSSTDPRLSPYIDPRQRLFPAIAERRMDNSSSDSDDESP